MLLRQLCTEEEEGSAQRVRAARTDHACSCGKLHNDALEQDLCISVKLNPAASVCWTRGQKPVREASGTVAVQSRKFLCAPGSRGMCFQALLLQQYTGPWSDVKDQEAPNALVLLAEEARDWAKTCRKAAGKQHLAASSSACIPESFCELSPPGWIPQGWMSLAFLQPFKEQIW